MRRALWLVFITTTLLLGLAVAQKRNITEKDLFSFNWIADPRLSPDGSMVAFVRVTVSEKKDGYNTSIWTVSPATGESHQLTNGSRDITAFTGRQVPCFVRVTEGWLKISPAVMLGCRRRLFPVYEFIERCEPACLVADGKTIAFQNSYPSSLIRRNHEAKAPTRRQR